MKIVHKGTHKKVKKKKQKKKKRKLKNVQLTTTRVQAVNQHLNMACLRLDNGARESGDGRFPVGSKDEAPVGGLGDKLYVN